MGALRKAALRLGGGGGSGAGGAHHGGGGLGAVVAGWSTVWYTGATVCVITSKVILGQLPNHAWTLTFSQFLLTVAFCRLALAGRAGSGKPDPVSAGQWRILLAEGVTIYLGLVSTNTALGLMSASLVETIKATEPVPTVAIAALLMGEGWAPAAERAALAIIVMGVMLMSYAESTFLVSGLAATLSANFNFALANNISKWSFARDDRLDPLNFWYRTVQVSALLAAPAAFSEVRVHGLAAAPAAGPGAALSLGGLALLALVNGFAFFLYNQATCAILEHVTMSVHAVLNSVRRAVLIVATALYFGSEVSSTNAFGAFIAASGFGLFVAQKRKRPASGPAAPAVAASLKRHLREGWLSYTSFELPSSLPLHCCSPVARQCIAEEGRRPA